MERRDYLTKEIERLALLMAKLMGLKPLRKDDEIRAEAHHGYAEFFGMDFGTMDAEALKTRVLAVNDVQQLELLAQIMEVDINTQGHAPEQKSLREEVLKTVVAEVDRLYAQQGTFSLANQLRKK